MLLLGFMILIKQTDIQTRLLKNSSVHFETPGAQALELSDFRNKAAK